MRLSLTQISSLNSSVGCNNRACAIMYYIIVFDDCIIIQSPMHFHALIVKHDTYKTNLPYSARMIVCSRIELETRYEFTFFRILA